MSHGSRPCWKSQALNFPGSPDPLILLSHASACFSVLETLHLSVRDESYHFPRHLIGFSSIYGIVSPCTRNWNLLVTFPLLIGGWRVPDSIDGPLDSFSAAVMSRFIPMTNRIGEMVQPVTIPFSRSCHWVVKWAVFNRSLNPPKYW